MTAARLRSALLGTGPVPGRHLVVTAHPDDETISFGGALARLADVRIVQLTTGAPASSPIETVRRLERRAAFAAAGWHWPVVDGFAPDGAAHQHLASLGALIGAALAQVDVVWTHPYEAGHLDHDTAAWLVQRACEGHDAPLRMEFASYHCTARAQTFGDFWPDASALVVETLLTGEVWTRKQAAIAAYVSQTPTLRKFPCPSREVYRAAPRYDFTRPAAPPRCRWDVKGYQPTTTQWRQTVAQAARRAA